jgi:hypothetical protein
VGADASAPVPTRLSATAHRPPNKSARAPPVGVPRERGVHNPRESEAFGRWCYLTSESILNIGRYIAITMTPTIIPTRIIISGSTIDVSDWIAASTSSS